MAATLLVGMACALQPSAVSPFCRRRCGGRHAWVEPRATALCAAVSDGGADVTDVDGGRPNWRLAVQRARDPQTGREESRLALEPTDGRWAARQIEVEIDL